jgi:biotin-[acetyl-CoA-carboxylase] ligase BirA-like protein
MITWTDNPDYANELVGGRTSWRKGRQFEKLPGIADLAGRLLRTSPVYSTELELPGPWTHSFFLEKAPESQFDWLAKMADELPHAVLCCAGSGDGFHGLRRRPWQAMPGNIHLSALFQPNQKMANSGIAFTVLAVATVLQTIDSLGIQGAMVKWVNDVLIDESKVAGVLVHMRTQGEEVTSALVGIGLNVETRPRIPPTPFVPRADALKSFGFEPAKCTHGLVFRRLTSLLAENYEKLLSGSFPQLLEFYRRRSIVIGRMVTVFEDLAENRLRKIVRGKVTSIGKDLELNLEGIDKPVWQGRLVLEANDLAEKL